MNNFFFFWNTGQTKGKLQGTAINHVEVNSGRFIFGKLLGVVGVYLSVDIVLMLPAEIINACLLLFVVSFF